MTHFPDLFHRIVDGGNAAMNIFELEVSRGNIYGISTVDVRGRCSSIGANIVEVWEPASGYIFPTGTLQLNVSSSSDADSFTG